MESAQTEQRLIGYVQNVVTVSLSLSLPCMSVVFLCLPVIEFNLCVTSRLRAQLLPLWKAGVCLCQAQERLCAAATLLSCDHVFQGEGGVHSRA